MDETTNKKYDVSILRQIYYIYIIFIFILYITTILHEKSDVYEKVRGRPLMW